MAYFENHDSLRATKIWHERYAHLLAENNAVKQFWEQQVGQLPAKMMALLRNLQCSVIDATVGSAHSVNMAYALEWGSEWGEEERTDFEEPTLLLPELATQAPNKLLVQAYGALQEKISGLDVLREGHIYFYRGSDLGDEEDRVLAYARYTDQAGLLVLHNLDAGSDRQVICPIHNLPHTKLERVDVFPLFDTYAHFQVAVQPTATLVKDGFSVRLGTLQSLVFRVVFRET